MGTFATAPQIDKIMITLEQMECIDHFTGRDFEGKTARRPRPTSSPDFTILVNYIDGEGDTLEASIVASNVPQKGKLRFDEPYAIASVDVDGQEMFLLINADGTLSDRFIQYEGEPEELLQKTHLFDTE